MSQNINIQPRLCMSHVLIDNLSSVTPVSLTVPDGAVSALIQADGGVVRVRLDAGTVSATTGLRIENGATLAVDSALSQVRLIAQTGSTTDVQVAFFNKV